MKKIYTLIFFLVPTIICAQNFIVNEFNVDIHLSSEGYFDVVEEYDITFSQPSHGIYRDIITKYDTEDANGETSKRNIYLSKIKVPDHKFTTSSKGMQKTGNKVEIKIGDKNRKINGQQHYTIKYRVKNALIDNDSIVQFFWNAKPSQWKTTFKKINFRVHTPDDMNVSDKNAFVYAGRSGNSIPSEEFDYTYENKIFSGQSKSDFSSNYGESVTVLIKMPGDLFEKTAYAPSWWSRFGWLGILGGVGLLVGGIWHKNRRSKKVVTTTSYYPPKGIDPAMANYILNNKADNKGLIAFIPEWGRVGLIKVKEVSEEQLSGIGKSLPKEKLGKAPKWAKKAFNFLKRKTAKTEIKLTKLNDIPNDAPQYEIRIFTGLFAGRDSSVLVSDLKNKFYKYMEKAKKDLRKESKTYYDKRSIKISKYLAFGSIISAILFGYLFFTIWGIIPTLFSVGFFILLAILSGRFVKRNKKGNEALSELRGFKQFIDIAEINRIKMLLKEDPEYFEKTMGYAVAFDLLDKWAGKFDDLSIEPPEWYENSSRVFTTSAFAHSFGNTLSKTQTVMVSSPKSSSPSSGGGSSGGGFGGGGGGSW